MTASIGALKREKFRFLHPVYPSNTYVYIYIYIYILLEKTQGLLQPAGSCSVLGSSDRALV